MRLQAFLPLAFAATRTLAMNMGDEAYRAGHGMIGYGIPFARPRCAFSCRDAISGARLQCSDVHEMEGMDPMVMTSSDCYAKDDAFLQTLAVCLSTRCSHIPAWELEKYWKANVPGTFLVQPDPKETYQQALAKVNGTPSVVYAETGSLNQTSIVSDELYIPAFNSNEVFGNQEAQQVKYGLVILLSGVIIPIAFSLLRFFPFPAALRAKFNAWIIDPPLFGSKHDSPVLYGLTHVPTRGQALFISYFIVINVVLSAVNYEYANPNTWYPGKKWRWMLMLVSNRLGLISFANMPLLFLYAGRNNFLLWLTDWSHSTFLLLHRWIAGIATLEAILHSILYLAAYVKAGTHNEEAKEPYWYWGIIATLGMTILFPCSITPIRKKMYELFLAWHVAISILVIAGCYWHIVFCFSHKWGYETWIIMCMAIWAFDRVFRVVRLGRYGIKTAQITVIDDDYVRVVIPNVSASGHAYLYFPTLTWRVWENHPFSVASSMLGAPQVNSARKGPKISHDMEKQINVNASPTSEDNISRSSGSSNIVSNTLSAGITFYIRTETGITSALRKRTSLPVLLESGYSSHSPSALNKSPILVAIAGGVGITAVLPHLATHPGRIKLFWGARTQSLVDDVVHSGALSRIEYDTVVGSRLAVREILEGELAAAGNVEVAVLVSGPDSMIDEVRNVVGEFVRRGSNARVGLHVESFSW